MADMKSMGGVELRVTPVEEGATNQINVQPVCGVVSVGMGHREAKDCYHALARGGLSPQEARVMAVALTQAADVAEAEAR